MLGLALIYVQLCYIRTHTCHFGTFLQLPCIRPSGHFTYLDLDEHPRLGWAPWTKEYVKINIVPRKTKSRTSGLPLTHNYIIILCSKEYKKRAARWSPVLFLALFHCTASRETLYVWTAALAYNKMRDALIVDELNFINGWSQGSGSMWDGLTLIHVNK